MVDEDFQKPGNMLLFFCSGASSSAEASAVTASCAVAETDSHVSATAARAQTDVPEATDKPVSLPRRHGVLRVQGRRISATGDSVDEARTSACRQGQVSVRHVSAPQPSVPSVTGRVLLLLSVFVVRRFTGNIRRLREI